MPELKQYEAWLRPRGGGSEKRDNDLAGELLRLWKAEAEERRAAKRLLDWYHRNHTEIAGYIRKQASITFGDETKDWQIPVVNGVKRTIKRVSMLYKNPPERKYFIGDTELDEGHPELGRIERMYKGLNINRRMLQIDRMRTLLNTVHVEPVYRNGRLDWDARLRPDVLVTTDPSDYLRFLRFAQRLDFTIGDKPTGGFIVWTDEEYFFIRDDGYKYPIAGSGTVNPFAGADLIDADRPIPVVTMRVEECGDYWGRFGSDIVDSFEQACIQLGNLWENSFLQTHGIPVATNLGWSKKKGAAVKVGPKNPITVDDATKDDLQPTLEFAKPEPDITEVQDLIDWFVKLNGGSYGISAAAWSQEEKAQSGYAKMLDNFELLEDRDEQISDAAAVESKLFEYSKLIWNENHPNVAEHVHRLARCEAVFSEVDFPESPTEEATSTALEIQNDLASPVDYIMKRHKISDRDEAMKKAKEIVKENAELKKMRQDILGPPPGFEGDGNPPNNRDQ